MLERELRSSQASHPLTIAHPRASALCRIAPRSPGCQRTTLREQFDELCPVAVKLVVGQTLNFGLPVRDRRHPALQSIQLASIGVAERRPSPLLGPIQQAHPAGIFHSAQAQGIPNQCNGDSGARESRVWRRTATEDSDLTRRDGIRRVPRGRQSRTNCLSETKPPGGLRRYRAHLRSFEMTLPDCHRHQ